MKTFDLRGADWHKIDSYVLHMLEDDSGEHISFSGTRDEYIEMMVRKGRYTDRSVPLVIKLHDVSLWPKEPVAGVRVFSRSGSIWPASVTFQGVLALAKDPNVLSVEGSRPSPDDYD